MKTTPEYLKNEKSGLKSENNKIYITPDLSPGLVNSLQIWALAPDKSHLNIFKKLLHEITIYRTFQDQNDRKYI
jgi:hypothetical protein